MAKHQDGPREQTSRVRDFYNVYTRGFSAEAFQRLFTRDSRDAYRYFSNAVDREGLAILPWWKRPIVFARGLFLALAMKMSPARRVLFAAGARGGGRRHVHDARRVPHHLDPDRSHRPPLPAARPRMAQGNSVAPAVDCGPRIPHRARGVRTAVAQERSRDRPRHPAGDAAAGPLFERRARGVRRDARGQHGRRRLLRHPAAPRRPGGHRPGRRGRQGQPGGAAHGDSARHAAHAARRRPRRGAAHQPPQRPDPAPRALVALHHAAVREHRPGDGRPRGGQRRAPAGNHPPAQRGVRTAHRRRHRPRHVRQLHLRHRARAPRARRPARALQRRHHRGRKPVGHAVRRRGAPGPPARARGQPQPPRHRQGRHQGRRAPRAGRALRGRSHRAACEEAARRLEVARSSPIPNPRSRPRAPESAAPPASSNHEADRWAPRRSSSWPWARRQEPAPSSPRLSTEWSVCCCGSSS